MVCNRKTAFISLFIAASLFTAFLTGCSSSKAPPSIPEQPVVEEPEPEPTLTELVSVMEAAWYDEHTGENATGAETGSMVLFEAPAALPAGDRLARKWGTALGSFLADAERGFLEDYGITTDFAFLNAELIRAGLPEGPVTKQDIERVLPFGQTICIVEMSGRQLLDLFADIGALPQGAGGFAQVSDGVSYTLTFDETGFNARISDVLVGGVPVDAARTYRVALNDFVAAGGNGYSFFLRDDVVKVKTSIRLADAIADYCLEQADLLYMKQGERITVLGGIAE